MYSKNVGLYRERYLAVGPNFADKVEWNFAQVATSAIAASLAAFAVYIGLASAVAIVTAL